jgi:hypothetical protein
MKRILLIIVMVAQVIAVYSQNETSYELTWQLAENQFLAYETIMEELEESKYETNDYLTSLFDTLGFANDSIDMKTEFKKLFESMQKDADNYYLLSVLNKKDSRVEVSMLRKVKEDAEESSSNLNNDFPLDKFKEMQKGVQFRGELNEFGGIYSYYLQRKQKNLLALFFQLPEVNVKVGDTWSIDLQWLGTDFTFDCDSANRFNQVSLVEINVVEKDTIAKIKYDIHEYILGDFKPVWNNEAIESEMSMDYDGICEFNVSEGKWISFNAIMTLKSTGFQNISQKFRYSLIETSIDEDDKSLIKE